MMEEIKWKAHLFHEFMKLEIKYAELKIRKLKLAVAIWIQRRVMKALGVSR